MYNEKELFDKIEKHIPESDKSLLKSLVSDIDEFNETHCNKFTEVYIDFDNVGTDSEGDTYETFSLKLHIKNNNLNDEIKSIPVIVDGLSIHELDFSCCTLEEYFNEVDNVANIVNDKLQENNIKTEKLIQDYYKENRIVYMDLDGLNTASFDSFSKQGLDGQLYDINRLPEVIYTLKDHDISKYEQRWVNDIALVNLLKYYYNKCADLEAKLRMEEEKNITDSIIGK